MLPGDMTVREKVEYWNIRLKKKGYNIIDYLGKGGFAEVYEGTCLNKAGHPITSDRAIKIIRKDDATWWRKHERFVRDEIEIHGKIDNENIVKLHESFEDEQAVYLILELCSKGSLHTYIKKQKRLDEKKVFEIFEQIVKGVQYLHIRQVIHRDLTPRNILLTEDMKVKIADFGLAAHLNEAKGKRKRYTVCGTPGLMAPEMTGKKGHQEKLDCWNLGLILYALIVGEIPDPKDKIEYPVDISPQANELLHRLLEKDPTKRICIDAVPDSGFFKKYKKNSYRSRDSGNGSRNHLSSAIEKESRLRSLLDSGFNSKNSNNKNGKSSSKKYHTEEKLSERRIFLQKDKLLPSKNNFSSNDHTRDRKRSASEDRTLYKPLSYNNSRQMYNGHERSVSAERERNENLKLSLRHHNVNDAYGIISSDYYKDQEERYKSNDNAINSGWKIYQSSNPEQGKYCVNPMSCKFSNSLLEGQHKLSPSNSCCHSSSYCKCLLPNINNPEKLNEDSLEQLTPLNAARLKPRTHMPNDLNIVLRISTDHQVIVEVLKKKKKYVSEVIIISTDGKEIKTYKPPKKTRLDYDCPPPFPNDSKEIKSYDLQKLTKSYHQSYLVAKQFVDILRANRPRLINNGKNAKFYVMENCPDPDMKMEFYDGGRVLKKGQKITIIDKLGKPIVYGGSQCYDELDKNSKSMLEEFRNEKEDCERILNFFMEHFSSPNFPIVLGEAKTDIISTRQKIGKENFAPTSKTNRRNGDR